MQSGIREGEDFFGNKGYLRLSQIYIFVDRNF